MVREDVLAAEALSIMNYKRISALCVYRKNKKRYQV